MKRSSPFGRWGPQAAKAWVAWGHHHLGSYESHAICVLTDSNQSVALLTSDAARRQINDVHDTVLGFPALSRRKPLLGLFFGGMSRITAEGTRTNCPKDKTLPGPGENMRELRVF